MSGSGHGLATIQRSDFEIIDTGPDIVLTYDCTREALIEQARCDEATLAFRQ